MWDSLNKWNYRCSEEPHYDLDTEEIISPKYRIEADVPFEYQESYWPFVKYQYSDDSHGFWGNGFDSLITANKITDILMTILGSDNILETLRILLLNFIPDGTGGNPGELSVGLTQPMYPKNDGVPGVETDPKAEIISADLYTTDMITFIDQINNSLSSMYGIDNPLTSQIKADLSGAFLRLKLEVAVGNWQKDISIARPYDRALIRKLVVVNNFHRKKDKQIDEKILDNLFLDYATPSVVTDEKSELEIKQGRIDMGLTSVIIEAMRENPEFSEEQAEKYVLDNLETTNRLTGLSPTFPISEEEEKEIIG